MSRGFGRVDIFTPATIELDGFFVCNVGQADGQEWLGLTKDAWAAPEIYPLVFLELDESDGGVLVKRDFVDKVK